MRADLQRVSCRGAPRFHNTLEPTGLYTHFVDHPPVGFRAWFMADGTPAFSAPLDPLLTTDDAARRRIHAIPLVASLARRLRLRTLFAGTTVSEYVPLATSRDPEDFADELLRADAPVGLTPHRLVVVKDLPDASPLLDDASNRHAAAVTRALAARGFAILAGQGLAWLPIDFRSIDEHLSRRSRGARRDIRRKLRARRDIDVDAVSTGDPIFADPARCRELYVLYRNVYEQSLTRFDLLARPFLDNLLCDGRLQGRVFLYHRHGRLIGFNLCFVYGDALVDKLVGFDYPAARDANLYCVSWMHNVEYALERGLTRYVAGWTDPAVKAHLGARFTLTRHAVYARNPLLRALLHRAAARFEADGRWLAEHAHATART